MRAELAASLCIPEDRPVELDVGPVKMNANVSGNPVVSAAPIELELPKISVTVPVVTLDLPDPTVSITIGPGPDNVVTFLQSMLTLLNSLMVPNPIAGLPPLVPILPPASIIYATAVAAIPAGVIRALAVPTLQIDADVSLGEAKLTVDKPLTADLGEIRLHGVPVEGDDQPITIGADLDETALSVVLDGLRAALTGCVVLNGGDPPTAPGPKVNAVTAKAVPEKDIMQMVVHGQGFGSARGAGFLLLNQMGATIAPGQYVSWDNQKIEVLFKPIPAQGMYVVTVASSGGETASSLPVNLP